MSNFCSDQTNSLKSIIGTAPERLEHLAVELLPAWKRDISVSEHCPKVLPSLVREMTKKGRNIGVYGIYTDSNKFANDFFDLGATVPSPPRPPLPESRSRTYWNPYYGSFPQKKERLIQVLYARKQSVLSPIEKWSFQVPQQEIESFLHELLEKINIPPSQEQYTDVLVCCHGARDFCCGKNGPVIYKYLSESAPENIRIWQSTHLGGHRFAPTMLLFDEMRFWGKLTEEKALSIIQKQGNLEEILPCYRGASYLFSPFLQKAEKEFIKQEGWQGFASNINLIYEHKIEENLAHVGIEEKEKKYFFKIKREKIGESIASCQDTKPQPLYDYTVI